MFKERIIFQFHLGAVVLLSGIKVGYKYNFQVPFVVWKSVKFWILGLISQFIVAVWAWADKGHCRSNCEIHGDKTLDTCSWKLCNLYLIMHKQCTPWYIGGSILWKGEAKAIYVAPPSLCIGVIISKCRSETSSCFKDLWIFAVIWDMC